MRVVATCHAPAVADLARAVRHAARRLAAVPGGLVEARLDLLARPPGAGEVVGLVDAAAGRLVVTCRREASGCPATEADRLALLASAARAGAAAVDVEHDDGDERPARQLLAHAPPACLVLLSWHGAADGAPPEPADVAARARVMARRQPSVVKLAAAAGAAEDALPWMLAGADAVTAPVGWAPVPLGPAGRGLRLLSRRPVRGRALSALLYCAAGPALPGPDLGQPSLSESIDVHAAHRVGAATRVLAVVGWPLAATWSPRLHGTLFRRAGRDAILVPLPVRDVGRAEELLDALGVVGLAVSAPHKEAALRLVGPGRAGERPLAGEAGRAGVVNTLRRAAPGEPWEGASFDGAAARAAIEDAGPLAGRRLAVLGAGGAARALVAALEGSGAQVHVLARRLERAHSLAADLGASAGTLADLPALGADVVVNATPVGSAPRADEAVVPVAGLSAHLVMDMVTTPPDTALLKAAREAGLAVRDGLGMLARQAAAQQAWWGQRHWPGEPPPPPAEVEALLREIVAEDGRGPDRRA